MSDEQAVIYLAHGDEDNRPVVEQMLKSLHHSIPLVTDSGKKLIEACVSQRPDLLISTIKLSDMDGIEALIECSRLEPIPSIIISDTHDYDIVRKALEDHVMAYLAEPVAMSDLKPAIYLVQRRFQEFEDLRQENDELKTALESRKLVERAKGIIMKKKNLDEDAAYRELRRLSNDRRTKMAEIAKTIVESSEMLGD
ncbi:MAG: ANTAR domain-containing protein [Planctomycetaceae bacterium]